MFFFSSIKYMLFTTSKTMLINRTISLQPKSITLFASSVKSPSPYVKSIYNDREWHKILYIKKSYESFYPLTLFLKDLFIPLASSNQHNFAWQLSLLPYWEKNREKVSLSCGLYWNLVKIKFERSWNMAEN